VRRIHIVIVLVSTAATAGLLIANPAAAPPGGYVAFTTNDLGMHCVNSDFSEICILPPYNTVRTEVFRRGGSPERVHENLTVTYSVPSNTHSSDKSNFWAYAQATFGVDLPPDIGLTGHGMAGSMTATQGGRYEVTGIPIVPIDDSGKLDPYPVAEVRISGPDGTFVSHAVVPVSSEMACTSCHGGNGVSMAHDMLVKHDAMHGTSLVDQKPVLCASCHADVVLGAPGVPGVPAFSHAMHGSHAVAVEGMGLKNSCYACHPGERTQCQRDVHSTAGVDCVSCHGGMSAVGNPARRPWVDLPRCGDCHDRPGFEFEPPGVLFKDATGHGGVHCTSCHNSPHAITPTITEIDNQQAITLQGHAGVIDTCIVCHTQVPSDPFPHRGDDD